MTRLGMIYHNALGTGRDPAEAARWWRCAAELGDGDGQAILGAAYHLGAGVESDAVQSMAWLLRAQRNGSPLVQPFLGAVRARLSESEFAEAERIASEPLPPVSP